MHPERPKQPILHKIDNTVVGFILGLIIPMLMLVLLYFFKFRSMYNWDAFIVNIKDPATLPGFIRNCVFLNLPFFFVFNLLKSFNICKGIFIASIIYIIAMFAIKYIH